MAAALGYSNPRDAIIRHCRYVVKRDAPHPQSPDRKISMTFIPGGDLYRLIVHSKLPSAEQFERWVFDEVLPTIRKHGAYLTKEKLWEIATSPEALMKLCSDLLAEREANISLRKESAQLEGKAAFYDLFIDLKHSTNFRTTAKELMSRSRSPVRFLSRTAFCTHGIRQCAALCQCEKYRAVLRQRLLQPRSYRFLHAVTPPRCSILPSCGNDLAGLIRKEVGFMQKANNRSADGGNAPESRGAELPRP